MEDSFSVRVDKVFGRLDTGASLSSLWSLTDEEIERKEWNRHKDNFDDHDQIPKPKPHPSKLDVSLKDQQKKAIEFRKELESDLQELDENDEMEEDEKRRGASSSMNLARPDGFDDEEWGIRCSIGVDCTLDDEEEEDTFDKVAIGKAETEDRLYMREISDYTIDVDSYMELPTAFSDVMKDPRADHMAAIIRLNEDAEASGSSNSSQLSQCKKVEDRLKVKSICDCPEFDPSCKDSCKDGSVGNKSMDGSLMEEAIESEAASVPPQDSSHVPDHVQNPSKYTHYTFDTSDDIDEEANRKAHMDFLNTMKGPKTRELQDMLPVDLPESVSFIPKKPPGKTLKEYTNKKGFRTAIAAGDSEESEVCAMEEDEPETAAAQGSSFRGRGRRYREKNRFL
ncbi:hypothetical protein RJ639_028896 [Escallonia herrerae]|uniref:U5 small nuclear ribonucleoprotein TSSC4 n=1 Tax=Escallonia herrerae TaxID=1293975 RepID=A0AA89BEG1_9ASTE|nr:hypothetical protein RJ639_028896 [Escallonia herrerae]